MIAFAQRRMRMMLAKAARTIAKSRITTTKNTTNILPRPTCIMKMKRKSKIPKYLLLITAICINSLWPWLGDGGDVGVSLLPLACGTHMTVTAGDAIAHTFTIEMRGQNHYHDGGGGGGADSSGRLENMDLENMDMHAFDYDTGIGGVPKESEERDHIAHHFARTIVKTKTTTMTNTTNIVPRPTSIMKMKRKSKISKYLLLITAICINSFWPSLSDVGDAGGSLLPLVYGTHMTVTAGDAIAHTFTIEMRGQNHYHDGGGGGGADSSGRLENMDLENMDMHAFDYDTGIGGVPKESEERDHIAHHFEMKHHEELLEDIRDDASTNFLPDKDLPKFGEPLQNVTVPVGREAVLQCVVDNLQTYKIAWLRVDTQTILTIQNHVITKNNRMSITHAEKRAWILRIRDVKEADKGWYMCQINTDPMKSQVGYLDVVVPPDILDYPTSTDIVMREGANVTLKCAAVGSPTPTITWRREGGEPIPLHNNTEVTTYNGSYLTITKVQRLNMGAYLCIASNGIPPTVSKRVMMIVHFPPMVWIQNQLVGAATRQNIALECQSEAYPKSINYWTKNDTIIVPGEHFASETFESGYKITMRLTIKDVDTSDFGFYRCVAKNSLGDTDGTIKLYHIPQTTTVTTLAPTVALNTVPVVVTKHNNKDQRFSKKDHRTKSNVADISSSSALNNVYVGATSSLWNSQDHGTGREHNQFLPCKPEVTSNVICGTKPADQLVSPSVDSSSAFSSNHNSHLKAVYWTYLLQGLYLLFR